MEEQELKELREYWLRRAVAFLVEHMARCGLMRVTVRVSCGWPSHGGLGQGKAVVGQCFSPQVCADGVPQIFISPRLADSVEVLGTLLHELVHASVGTQYGHKKGFSQAARKMGLAGPPTATVVSEALRRKDDPVFLADDGKPLTVYGVSGLFETLRKRTGIDGKKMTPHQCRRFMATSQLVAGRSPLDVQRQMGHTTLTMTNHYASLGIEQLRRSHEQYSPLRKKPDPSVNYGIGTGYWEEE